MERRSLNKQKRTKSGKKTQEKKPKINKSKVKQRCCLYFDLVY